ncbi:pirin family protein, partial [Bacteroidaceae bacterium UO.H1004]|nr:pirin family protein [Bacteroidaceae bacterium UO.H1004]
LTRRDGIGIWDTESIIIKTNEESQVLAIEVAL